MNALILKVIACAAMLIDHIGYAWHITPFRYIGRIAFPIFAFLIVNGYRHTHDLKRYMLRLALFALLSEVPYDLLFYGSAFNTQHQNVFITLLLGLCCIAMMDAVKSRHVLLTLLPVAACCAAAMVLNCDYGYIGVLTVIAFHIFNGNDIRSRLCLTAAIALLTGWQAISYYAANAVLSSFGINLRAYVFTRPFFFKSPGYMQLPRVLGLIPIFLYNEKKGSEPKSKAAKKALQLGFYIFYPAHILILYILKHFVFK